ncbi:MAG: hypothetical protein COB66_08220 [Coxiella sp. (in: Bacteria)]|nr:MAG: hypothetical protein COB66_08220 [Coxiella sp. (in: g-proteobacteria)]
MITSEEKIQLPMRADAPVTYLYCKVLLKDNSSLGNRPVMIFVPGGPGGNHAVYLSMATHLLEYADLILFDPRGCGGSDSSDALHCSIDHYIDDIEAIRAHFNVNELILLGGSYGAMASLGYAIRYPERLEKLILLAGAPSYKFIETAKQNLEKRGAAAQKAVAQKLWNGEFKDANEFADFYNTMASLYSATLKDKPPTTSSGIPYNVEITNLGFKNFLRTFNFEHEMQNIRCETLIICGQDDWINDPSHARLMASNIQTSTLHVFENCGHFAEVDQPTLFFDVLDNFLATSG